VISRLWRDVVLGRSDDWNQHSKDLKIGFVQSTLVHSEAMFLFSIILEAQCEFSNTHPNGRQMTCTVP
jgi:hypothetical protein